MMVPENDKDYATVLELWQDHRIPFLGVRVKVSHQNVDNAPVKYTTKLWKYAEI